MKKEDFFKYYIPALEQALNYKRQIDFEIIGPDMFIDDDKIRNDLDQFENDNYKEYERLFSLVSIYFDAKNHNLKNVKGQNIAFIKEDIIKEIETIKRIYF